MITDFRKELLLRALRGLAHRFQVAPQPPPQDHGSPLCAEYGCNVVDPSVHVLAYTRLNNLAMPCRRGCVPDPCHMADPLTLTDDDTRTPDSTS